MGACTFYHSIGKDDTINTPAIAYDALVDEAMREYGHDTYNGTISTTDGFSKIIPSEGETLQQCIARHIGSDSSPVQKWGEAGCIETPKEYHFFGWAAQ